MTQQRHSFFLASEESAYLKRLASDQPAFMELLKNAGCEGQGLESLSLTTQEAETLREYFTERLAQVGFDTEYKLTHEGIMLERLIDELFVPA
jgi:hypothetical protein